MLQSTIRNFPGTPEASRAASDAPAGSLIVLGLTAMLFSLYHAGFFPFGGAALGMGLFYGALGQMAAGLRAWKRHNAFGAVLGVAFGLFWLSQVAMVALPETGFGRAPAPLALSSYLALWVLFTSILFSEAGRFGRELQIFLALLGLFLLLLAAGAAAGSPLLNAVAGGEGMACGLAGLYAGITRLMSEAGERTLPRPEANHPT
jgi:succinate-acetate transporter protein